MQHRQRSLSSLLCGGAWLIAATALSAQSTLESFDDLSASDAYFAGTWEASGSITGTTAPASSFAQGSGTYDITGTGVLNDADSFLELHFSSAPLDLSAYNALSLQASTLPDNAATSVELRLFDTAGNSAYAAIAVTSLPAVVAWTADPSFDPAAVEIVRLSGGQLDGTAAVSLRLDELSAVDATTALGFHSADYDQNNQIDLSELLRVIELYNTRNGTTRTGRYLVDAGTTDGFAPDPTTVLDAPASLSSYHSADYDRDAQVSLSELLRVIELYNTRDGTTRTGEYHRDAATVDGFAPGPEPTS
ncbi:hypothetical protein [Actomonas aquatica]|uniref:EF-hand domain-containing protein n=1 Tax=Actomonas aquatica TaxID=2866162 RepID=A0ABZ1C494_9BACT|nr:hypothetical protein [Opitutus sp. WL0086]WRQ86182.1 hypothetical protein K1X11_015310 [Opitutus sp. WL0086]